MHIPNTVAKWYGTHIKLKTIKNLARAKKVGTYYYVEYTDSRKAPSDRTGHAVLCDALGIDLVPPATRYEQYIARLQSHARKGNRAVALTACRKLNAFVGTDAARFVL
mgnify:CR=1 FL=1